MLATDLRLNGHDILVNSSITKEQHIPVALAGVAVLVELIGILTRVEDDMSSCDKIDLARVVSD